ncbi:LSU ribosomal protein L30p (L7e) [hydrothermal vent metagenome]|uniref:LSU ribosomal protein L30p (L7e) n=1 Tax=hydrothermal vent metagenome TaxID=652676 RepID=A0A3B0VXD2_9ZZZZ
MADKQGQIKVTLRKSAIGYNERQKKTVKGLGLGKLNGSRILKDTPEIRGMVQKVIHLVDIEEVVS